MIGYTRLGTNDLPRAQQFYDAVWGTVGIGRLMDFGDGSSYGISWDKPLFGIGKPFDGPATAGNGTMIAIPMAERALVDAVHSKALSVGGKDEGAPGIRYSEEGDNAFYSAYFRDPDGNKLCIYRIGAA